MSSSGSRTSTAEEATKNGLNPGDCLIKDTVIEAQMEIFPHWLAKHQNLLGKTFSLSWDFSFGQVLGRDVFHLLRSPAAILEQHTRSLLKSVSHIVP